ncbi:hypothetical protein [Candidatus Magnetaquiglobus chichijimensis]
MHKDIKNDYRIASIPCWNLAKEGVQEVRSLFLPGTFSIAYFKQDASGA